MAVAITIAGTEKQVKAGSLRIMSVANGRATASFTIESTDGSYRPSLDAEVIITEDGTRIFGGLLDRPRERGLVEGAKAAIATMVSAADFHAYAERRYVNETLAAGTLKSQLTTLVNNYLDDYGVTLHGSQADGPSLPAVEYNFRKLSDVLNELMTMTADAGEPYVWQIDSFKVLRAFQPSTTAAPFDITGDLPYAEVLGDIEVETTRDHYANRIIVKIPAKTEHARVETFTGDGSTAVFTLQYIPFAHRGYVTNAGTFETLTTQDFAGTATWTLDTDNGTLTRETGAPANGATITINFDGTFEGTATAQDAAEIAAHGIWERVVTVESVPSDTTAQALADGYLAKAIHATHTVRYKTLESGILPGQSQTITVARRNIDATATITDVDIRDFGKDKLLRTVTAVIDSAQTNLDRGWRDVYRLWAGDKTGAGSAPAAALGSGTVAQAGPSAPDKSVQFNNAGAFGGKSTFVFHKDENSIVCGGGGSSITAAVFESCDVGGYNCHIADP